MVSVPFRGLRGLEGGRPRANVAASSSFSPLPGFEGSGGSGNTKFGRDLTVSVPFRGLRGLEGGGAAADDAAAVFQSPSGV